ncbi:hypothetical protein LCGC14_2177620, partial [marine sediment metagenome]
LALVRSIAQSHDGQAWVESQPGVGSTFYVSLGAQCAREPQECHSNDRPHRETQLAHAHDSSAG